MRSTGGSGGGRGGMVTSIATGTAGGRSLAHGSARRSPSRVCIPHPGERPFPTTTRGDRNGHRRRPGVVRTPDRGRQPAALIARRVSATAADRKVAGPGCVGSPPSFQPQVAADFAAAPSARFIAGGFPATAAARGRFRGDAVRAASSSRSARARPEVHLPRSRDFGSLSPTRAVAQCRRSPNRGRRALAYRTALVRNRLGRERTEDQQRRCDHARSRRQANSRLRHDPFPDQLGL